MDLSIVIVNWNVKDLLAKCLKSIYFASENLDIEIFVVDNNSSDGSVEMLMEKFPKVNLIVNKENRGFAAANNQAIEKATGKYILLLNPDAEILDNSLEKSIQFMDEHPECGVMGSRVFNSDKTLQPSVRRFPTLWPILLIFLKLPKIFPKLKSIQKYLAVDFDYNKNREVDQVMGAFMMVRKEIFEKIGLLDKDFFIWFEEVDFCKRVWNNNYKVIFYPGAEIIHHGGKSFAQQGVVKKQRLFFKSALTYFKKHLFKK